MRNARGLERFRRLCACAVVSLPLAVVAVGMPSPGALALAAQPAVPPPGGAGLQMAQGAAVATTSDGKTISIQLDDSRAIVYRHGEVPAKPYVAELRTPGGAQVLLDAPADHPHHHGLMLAFGVDGVNFWAEGAGKGRQENVELGGVEGTAVDSRFSAALGQKLAWKEPSESKTLLVEERSIRLDQPAGANYRLVTWSSRLALPQGKDKAVLGGSHYFGLGLRFIPAFDGGKFFNSEGNLGEIVRGEERLGAARWCAATATVEGRPVTVAMFDHPDNPRHPARFFTMAKPFAYLSATLNVWKMPLEVTPEKPLELRYGVLLADGELTAEMIDAIYQPWASTR